MERAGDLQRDDAGAGRGLGLQLLERVERAGDDDLAAAVEVGGLEPELGEACEQLGLVAADDGAHAGGDLRGRGGHRTAALARRSASRRRR